MCGRFSQSMTREDYLALLSEEAERDIPYDPEPIGRFNVAPGTKVLLLNNRDDALHLDPVVWSYAPGWWDKQPLINARVETAATSRMFKPLWNHGRAIVFADGWYEWKKEGDKGPVDIHDRRPLALSPETAHEWMQQDVGRKEAEDISKNGSVSAGNFSYHPVSLMIGNYKDQRSELIENNILNIILCN